ncbi:MAG: damage-inducible protein DinB [Treponema sp.]|nr:damage-inducible protein DinB [Treponema sp.]
MDKTLVIFAKQGRAANQTVVDILAKLSVEEREKERGSYYHSLSGLVVHIVSALKFFQTLFKEPLASHEKASAALNILENLSIPQETGTAEQWKQLGEAILVADNALVTLIESLSDEDLKRAVPWFKGNPATVPLSYLVESLLLHGTHHRGQISQILDELKIDNDYSGISTEFLV